MPHSKNYLITGGAGFIGSNFVRFLYSLEPDANIRVLDKLTYSGDYENLREFEGRRGFEFIHGDICDTETVRRAVKNAAVVVNFAAEVAVDRSIDDPESFLRTDIYGVYVLLNELRLNAALKRFIQISTDEVYGQIFEGSFNEQSVCNPRNPYSAAKLGGERLAYSFFETYDMPVIITRASNNYGPYAYPEKVIPLFITNLIDGLPVPVYGEGKQVRDWVFVEDHCRAIYLLIDKGKSGQVYNVGGEQECTNLDLARKILTGMNSPEEKIRYVQDRPGHDFRYSLDSSRLKALGWAPAVSLEQGLGMTIQWYREHGHWWRPLKEKLDLRYIKGFWGEKEAMI